MKKRMTRNERAMYRRKMIEQRLMGLGMLAICVFIVAMALTGTTIKDRDVTPVILLAPLSIWLLSTRKVVIC